MCDSIPPQVYELLKTVVNGEIDNFKITVHDPNKKGDGFLGEVVYITLEDTNSNQVYDLVVKQAFEDKIIRDTTPIHDIYVNEIYFYSQIWTRLNKFQERIPQQYQFQKLPKYFASFSDGNSEIVVLENLKFQNFKVHNRQLPLDKDHYEIIMKEYGKFHALSFAYKALYPEDYNYIAKGVLDIYTKFLRTKGFQKRIRVVTEISIDSLQPGTDDVIKDKYSHYLEDYVELFQNSLHCNRKYSVITHGDCWSNNMMFKYNEEGKVKDVRFLDFQLCKEGSPCCDLSYCLYSGAPNDVLQDFDYYLKIYHNSLSETLKAFGCDSEKLYPFRVLKEEWKQYCKLGVIMGLKIWKVKCTYEDNVKDLTDGIPELEKAYYSGFDKNKYNKICRDLLVHLYENDFL